MTAFNFFVFFFLRKRKNDHITSAQKFYLYHHIMFKQVCPVLV